jgi:GNAT superfamily N-acetyltransferase
MVHGSAMDHIAKAPFRANWQLPGSSRRPPAESVPSGVRPVSLPELDRIVTNDGHVLVLREIDPSDVEALQRGFARLSPEEVRMRFLHPINELPHDMALHLCSIDRRIAVAFVLVDPPETPNAEIHAVARAHIDPATLAAEFALIVQGHLAGHGLGTLLMQRLITTCKARGATEMWGDVLFSNGAMLELCDHLGFARHTQWDDPGLARVQLPLS